MIFPSAIPSAASVPLPVLVRANTAIRQGAGGHVASSSLSSNPATTSRTNAGSVLNGRGNPTKATTNSQTSAVSGTAQDQTTNNVVDSTSEQAFDDIIQQISSEAVAPRTATANRAGSSLAGVNPGLFRSGQTPSNNPTSIAGGGLAAPATDAPLAKTANKKEFSGIAAASLSPAGSVTPSPVKGQQQDVPAIPVDIVAPLTTVKPGLPDFTSEGGVGEMQLHSLPSHTASFQPEAALNIVIRTASQVSEAKPVGFSPSQTETASGQTVTGSTTTDLVRSAVAKTSLASPAITTLADEYSDTAEPGSAEDIVATPLTTVKPRLPDFASEGGVEPMQLHSPPSHAASFQPEAAPNIVIRTASQVSEARPVGFSARQTETASGQTGSGSTETDVAQSTVAKPSVASPAIPTPAEEYSGSTAEPGSAAVPSVDWPAPAATAGDPQTSVPVSATGYETLTSPRSPVAAGDAEHRKMTIATDGASLNTEAAKSATPQAAAFQDLQLKAEPSKAGNSPPRADTQRSPAAAQEPANSEKSTSQPLKSVALEFTPDGARDVKVRLSERGGDVHVSVHSTDPSLTKNLRAGVTDLADVLAQAGYDARTWTSGRQHQGNPQQQEEQTPPRRNSKTDAGADNFAGILQNPNQETS